MSVSATKGPIYMHKLIEKQLGSVNDGAYDADELIRLYKNQLRFRNKDRFTEEDLDTLSAAIELKLRAQLTTRQLNTLFGKPTDIPEDIKPTACLLYTSPSPRDRG